MADIWSISLRQSKAEVSLSAAAGSNDLKHARLQSITGCMSSPSLRGRCTEPGAHNLCYRCPDTCACTKAWSASKAFSPHSGGTQPCAPYTLATFRRTRATFCSCAGDSLRSAGRSCSDPSLHLCPRSLRPCKALRCSCAPSAAFAHACGAARTK